MSYVFKICGKRFFNDEFVPVNTCDYIAEHGGYVEDYEIAPYAVGNLKEFLNALWFDCKSYYVHNKNSKLKEDLEGNLLELYDYTRVECLLEKYISEEPVLQFFCIVQHLKTLVKWDPVGMCFVGKKSDNLIVTSYYE